MLPPPPQPISRIAPSCGIGTSSKPQEAIDACEPPFMPATIIRPQKPSGLRVLLKILLRSPIVVVSVLIYKDRKDYGDGQSQIVVIRVSDLADADAESQLLAISRVENAGYLCRCIQNLSPLMTS